MPFVEEPFAAVANSALYTLHSTLLQHATSESFGTEFMDYKMAIRTVASLEEALAHIDQYGSGHSESIVTENEATARQFQQMVDEQQKLERECDAILLLDGWEKSKGVRLELKTALELDMKIYLENDLDVLNGRLCGKAK